MIKASLWRNMGGVKSNLTWIKRNTKWFIMNSIAGSYLCPKKIRNKILQFCGISLGKGVVIFPKNTFHGTKIMLGDSVFVNSRCFFDTNGTVIIKNNVSIGNDVCFITTNHSYDKSEKRAGNIVKGDIVIEDGCWIGARVVILPNVTIGKGSVIASGAVVTNDCESNSLYAGVPAEKKKQLNI